MALLIRIAQTQSGAEKLLDCRVLHVLSHCDFIDARPEGDQSFMGAFINPLRRHYLTVRHKDCDSFLPSAVYRYHQLVLPALALINSLVVTLGKSSRVPEQVSRYGISCLMDYLRSLPRYYDSFYHTEKRSLFSFVKMLLIRVCNKSKNYTYSYPHVLSSLGWFIPQNL